MDNIQKSKNQFVLIPVAINCGPKDKWSITLRTDPKEKSRLPVTSKTEGNSPRVFDGKKWTTFRLSQVGGASIPIKSRQPHSFVKVGTDCTTSSLYPPKTLEEGGGGLELSEQSVENSRMCGSPESGIECDEISSPDNSVQCDINSGVNVEPLIVENSPLSFEEIPQNKVCTSNIVENEEPIPDNSVECDINKGVVNAEPLMVESKRLSIEERSQASVCTSTIVVNEEPIRENDQDNDDELQIISVHSLASVADIADSQTPSSADDSPPCASLEKRGRLKRKIKEKRKIDSVSKKRSFCNDPLPQCRRLYVRRIKALNSGIKSVLVVEADYNHAIPLPASILNEPHETTDSIVEIKSDKTKYTYDSDSDLELQNNPKITHSVSANDSLRTRRSTRNVEVKKSARIENSIVKIETEKPKRSKGRNPISVEESKYHNLSEIKRGKVDYEVEEYIYNSMLARSSDFIFNSTLARSSREIDVNEWRLWRRLSGNPNLDNVNHFVNTFPLSSASEDDSDGKEQEAMAISGEDGDKYAVQPKEMTGSGNEISLDGGTEFRCEESECEDWQHDYCSGSSASVKTTISTQSSSTRKISSGRTCSVVQNPRKKMTPTKSDRISQLKEKLRKQEEDLEKVRERMGSFSDIFT